MRISSVVWLTAIALALVPSGFGADSIAWGPAVDGLRLGAAFGLDPSTPTLRVVLQNVGLAVQEVVIGHETGKGPSYDNMKFIATAPDGREEVGLHRGAYIPIAGLVLPISVSLGAGAIHEVELPLKDIIYAVRTTVTLEALVKQGYLIRVRFGANHGDAKWANLSRPWIGTLSSAEISPAR